MKFKYLFYSRLQSCSQTLGLGTSSLICTCQILQIVLSAVTDHMPIYLHLDLPTSSNPVPPLPSHSSPVRTLYHFKRLKDQQTKDAYTSALSKKVAKITPTFTRLAAQLYSSKISPQSFADTANAAIAEILQHAARVVLGTVDPPTPKKDSKPTDQHNTKHHSSQNPHEAHLQRTIQHHRDAIHTLKKDLSLDDPDTLDFHRDKIKHAQDALDQLRKTKKQDKLLSTGIQDAAHDVGPADHQHNSMWDYLKKYKNNHTTSSLPQKICSDASPDKRIWMKGHSTLNSLNWHCFRFALGHQLFQNPLSPYDEKSAQDIAKLLPRVKEQVYTATSTSHPLFMAPFTPEELKHEFKKLLADKSPEPSDITNRMLQAGDAEFQGLILIFFNGL